jgi:HJR/Mrr/RecB family endonuclease
MTWEGNLITTRLNYKCSHVIVMTQHPITTALQHRQNQLKLFIKVALFQAS